MGVKKGIISGTSIGVLKGDTGSLHYDSPDSQAVCGAAGAHVSLRAGAEVGLNE